MNAPQDLSRLVSARNGESIAPDSPALAARRLGIVAAFVAGADLVYTVLFQTLWVEHSNPVGLSTGVVGFVLSLAAAAYLLTGERPPARVAAVGLFYEVFLALSLALSEAWAISYAAPSMQVPWSAVVIVLFPFLVPARPAVMFGASLVAAAMTPLAMTITLAVKGAPWPAPGVVASFVLPPFVCALFAWAPTRILSQLTAAVERARRLGNYELTEKLGVGGMGEVWRANHRLLARPAAVKLIKPEILGAKDASARELLIRRFEQEAQVTASLDSPHTVELYDFGVSSDGALFYVMELLHGVDLDTLVERFGPLPPERVVHLLMQACDSLEDAHRRGLIHRDIKPANLFVSRKGATVDFLKLLDFGLVKRWEREEDDRLFKSLATSAVASNQTALGQIVGTPAFLAPEAALGEQALDHRADLYALGCVGYWMLTGTHVFAEDSVLGMAVAHVTKEPEPPSKRTDAKIPPGLERLLLSCLEKDRERRPASAGALRLALSEIPLAEPWTERRAGEWWARHLPAPARAVSR